MRTQNPTPAKAPEDQMIYKATIKKEFGLTDREIESLGAPDKRVKNPHYKSGPMASLYLLDRVVKFASGIHK